MKETEYYSERKKGIIGTVIFHVILLAVLMIFGFFTPLPLPGEEGILVNFGDSKYGQGKTEPSPARKKQRTPAPSQKTKPKAASPPKKETSQPVAQKSDTKPAKEAAMTQDYEKTAAIDAAERKKEEKRRKKHEAELKKKQKAEAERIRKAEAERKKQEEIDRQKRKEAEKLAREEAERKAHEEVLRKQKEEEQRKIAAINSRTQGAFSNGGNGNGGTGSGQGKSQGVTFPGGNQGVTSGDPNASNYGNGGSGSGNNGSGVSYSLSGRTAKALPKPHYPGDDAGTVVVKVTVDKYGKVTSAEPGARGTTIANQTFWHEAKQAALKAKFNINEKAPAFQQGTISYRFVLD